MDAERVWEQRKRAERAETEMERLREGIQRYMAPDPPHATDCASMDPYPAHGPCDCGVDEFIKSAAPSGAM